MERLTAEKSHEDKENTDFPNVNRDIQTLSLPRSLHLTPTMLQEDCTEDKCFGKPFY